jgi:S-formylglutathione hydrolase FrmB
MHRHLGATVVLPDGYGNSRLHYPTIYLLHGYGGNHEVWPRLAPLEALADSLHLIFICPDGENSWYLDSPQSSGSLFETFITRELLPYIDSGYRTVKSPRGRAVLGVSMGGHGAVLLLERHGDLFSASAAIAGIMDLTEFPQKWGLTRILGPLSDYPDRWAAASCISGIGSLDKRSALLILDCGLDDFALPGNREMDRRLADAGIRHTFASQPGRHDLRYAQKVAAGDIGTLSEALTKAY